MGDAAAPPAIALEDITCTFVSRGGVGRYTAVAATSLAVQPASSWQSSARQAAGSRRC
jgi:hypothetical protein